MAGRSDGSARASAAAGMLPFGARSAGPACRLRGSTGAHGCVAAARRRSSNAAFFPGSRSPSGSASCCFSGRMGGPPCGRRSPEPASPASPPTSPAPARSLGWSDSSPVRRVRGCGDPHPERRSADPRPNGDFAAHRLCREHRGAAQRGAAPGSPAHARQGSGRCAPAAHPRDRQGASDLRAGRFHRRHGPAPAAARSGAARRLRLRPRRVLSRYRRGRVAGGPRHGARAAGAA